MIELHTGTSIIGALSVAKRKSIKIKIGRNHQSKKPFYNSSCLILNYWSQHMSVESRKILWRYSMELFGEWNELLKQVNS